MLSAMLAAVLIAPVAADRKEPPSKIELFAGEGWYKDQKGKEEEFVGVLQFKDRPKDTVGFGRFNPYTLDMSDGKTKKVREVYVGSKPDLLKPYIGKKVKLIGKAVDMEVEGNKHHEIWPARLEVVPEKKEEKKEGAVRATLTLDPDAGGGPRGDRSDVSSPMRGRGCRTGRGKGATAGVAGEVRYEAGNLIGLRGEGVRRTGMGGVKRSSG